MKTSFSTRLKRYFTTGLLALLPIAAAIWVIIRLYKWIEAIAIKPLFQAEWINNLFINFPEVLIPWVQGFLGLIIIFFGISGLGFLTTNVVGRWFLGGIDAFMKKVPLANTVYSFVQGLIDNLRRMRSGYFQRVVLVEYPRRGIWSIGFISNELEGNIQTTVPGKRVAVFVPTSPNPTSGFIVVVDESEVLSLDITPEEALKFIVSGGVVMPGAGGESEPG